MVSIVRNIKISTKKDTVLIVLLLLLVLLGS